MKPTNSPSSKTNRVFNQLTDRPVFYFWFILLLTQISCSPFARLDGVIVDDEIAQGQEWDGLVVTREEVEQTTEANMSILKGDVIVTDSKSVGVMVVEDTWEVVILENTEVTILNPSIFQKIGKVIVKTLKKVKEKFKVKTEYVTAGTAGTEFLMEVINDNTYTVSVIEGSVLISSQENRWDSFYIETPWETQVSRNTGEKSSKRMSPSRVNQIRQMRLDAENSVRPKAPNLYGQDVNKAKLKLQNLGLITKEKYKITGKVSTNQIYNQKPEAGTSMKINDEVTLFVEEESVSVPNLINMNLSEAQSRIKNARLRVGKIKRVPRESGEAETVFSQSKDAGELVKPNTKINLDIVEPAVRMPNLVGMHIKDANRTLSQKNLRVGTQNKELRVGKRDHVFKQKPSAGSLHPVKDPVDVWIIEPGSQVPNLVNKSEAEAKSLLTNNKLVAGQISQKESSTVSKGNIISQNPKAGKVVKENSLVSYVVSIGGKSSQQCDLPNVVGQTEKAATATLKKLGFKVEIILDRKEGNGVIGQNPDPGNVKCNSTVTLTVQRIK